MRCCHRCTLMAATCCSRARSTPTREGGSEGPAERNSSFLTNALPQTDPQVPRAVRHRLPFPWAGAADSEQRRHWWLREEATPLEALAQGLGRVVHSPGSGPCAGREIHRQFLELLPNPPPAAAAASVIQHQAVGRGEVAFKGHLPDLHQAQRQP